MRDPRAWWWASEDGRIFCGARQTIVDKQDAAYRAWLKEGGVASPWPRDDHGRQSDDAMQAVLDPYGMTVNLHRYAALARWRAEIDGVSVGGFRIATDDRSKTMILGARLAAAADPNWSTVWLGADGARRRLDAAQTIALSDAVSAHVARTFERLDDVIAQIEAGRIASRAEVDAAFAE